MSRCKHFLHDKDLKLLLFGDVGLSEKRNLITTTVRHPLLESSQLQLSGAFIKRNKIKTVGLC